MIEPHTRRQELPPTPVLGVHTTGGTEGDGDVGGELQGGGGGQDDEVRPAESIAELRLDRVEESHGRVEVDIDWPVPLRGEPGECNCVSGGSGMTLIQFNSSLSFIIVLRG